MVTCPKDRAPDRAGSLGNGSGTPSTVNLTVNMTDLAQLKTWDEFMGMLRNKSRQGLGMVTA